MGERVRAPAAAAILGVTVRTVQLLAQRGTIPAARVGGVWTFDESRLRAWLNERDNQCRGKHPEVEVSRPDATGAAAPSGSARSSKGQSTAKAYEQMMRNWRAGKPSASARV